MKKAELIERMLEEDEKVKNNEKRNSKKNYLPIPEIKKFMT